jgi:hypothetical protein
MENSKNNNDEIEIDLRQIFAVIMSRIVMIKAGIQVTDKPLCAE